MLNTLRPSLLTSLAGCCQELLWNCWCNFWYNNAFCYKFVCNDNIVTLQLAWTFEDVVKPYLISSIFSIILLVHAGVLNKEKAWVYTNSLSPIPLNHDENQIPSDTSKIAYYQIHLLSRFLWVCISEFSE